MNATAPERTVHIRWMIRDDHPEVLAIERTRFEFPWSEEDFIRCLRQRNCIGQVAERDDRIIGYMVYALHKTRLHILNFAVGQIWNRTGVGRAMANRLISKVTPTRRTHILAEIRETNLSTQKFFLAVGFRAVRVLPDFYDDPPNEDAYLFRYDIKPEPTHQKGPAK